MAVRIVVLAAGIGALLLSGCASSHVDVAGIEASHPSIEPDRSDPRSLVLRDGDTVDLTTAIISVPGRPVRLCAPMIVADIARPERPAPTYCGIGFDATGVDLDNLAGRFAKDGAVSGTAHIHGTYRAGTVTVTAQSAAAITPEPAFTTSSPPCPPPAGGWPVGAHWANLDDDPVEAYIAAHPGAIADHGLMRPADDQVVMYILAAGDPQPIRDALSADFPNDLCVITTPFAPSAVERAREHIEALVRGGGASGLIRGYGVSYSDTGVPGVDVDVAYLTDEIVDAVADDPPGLVVFNAWITPVR